MLSCGRLCAGTGARTAPTPDEMKFETVGLATAGMSPGGGTRAAVPTPPAEIRRLRSFPHCTDAREITIPQVPG